MQVIKMYNNKEKKYRNKTINKQIKELKEENAKNSKKKENEFREQISNLNNQINKYQTCIGCSYCEAVCKFGALKVLNLEKGNVIHILKSSLYSPENNICFYKSR